jgi:hypothetical protein
VVLNSLARGKKEERVLFLDHFPHSTPRLGCGFSCGSQAGWYVSKFLIVIAHEKEDG